MTQVRKRNRWAGWLILPAALAVAGVIVWLRHAYPKTITTEDIAIFAAAITFAATFTAVRAAQASRAAAEDASRGLQLHFRPGQVRVGFYSRNPEDAAAQMLFTPVPNPAPLWIVPTSWDDVERDHVLVWVDDAGQSHDRRITLPAHSDGRAIMLEGIAAQEKRTNSGVEVTATLPELTLLCQDGEVKSRWRASIREPRPTSFNAQLMNFELDD